MTVSANVTSLKDPVYKPPPPTVATPAATPAIAAAILTFPTTQTPFHFVIKDLLRKQRLLLSWSSLRWVISRGIYPSSTFLAAPGSVSDLFSTQARIAPLHSVSENSTLDSPPLQQTDTILDSSITPDIYTFTRSEDIPDKAIQVKVDPSANSTDDDTLATPTPSSLEIAVEAPNKEDLSNWIMDTTTEQQQNSPMAIDGSDPLTDSQPSLEIADVTRLDDLPMTDNDQQDDDVDMIETDDGTKQGSEKDAVTLPPDEQPHSPIEPTHDVVSSPVLIKSMPPATSVSMELTSTSMNATESMQYAGSMESTPSVAPMEPTHTDLLATLSSPTSMETTSGTVLMESVYVTPMQIEPASSTMSESMEPATSAAPAPTESTPVSTPVTPVPAESTMLTASPIDSKTLLPRPESFSAIETAPQQSIDSKALLPLPESSSAIETAPQQSIDSKALLPRPQSSSASEMTRQVADSKALLPRPRSKTPSSNGSTTVPTNTRRPSPISSKTPLPRPSAMGPVGSSSTGNTTPSLRNSNPPMPPKRNSKLPIRASSSTPSGSLSSKRPAASPTVNKRRAITPIFSPTNPATPMTYTTPATSKADTHDTSPTNKTRVRTPGTTSIRQATRGDRKPMLTKMDHVIHHDKHGDEDDEEEERPKPISRKEKLARQAKRAEQIKFYRVREEREAREQRLVARRRLMAPSNNKHHNDDDFSDSGSSNVSSASATSSTVSGTKQRKIRTKGVKFNLNRNRVIEIRGGGDASMDDQTGARGSSSRIPHSIR